MNSWRTIGDVSAVKEAISKPRGTQLQSALSGCLAALLLVSACTSGARYAARAPTDPETRRVAEALGPLLEELDGAIRGDCPIGLLIIQSRAVNAGVRLPQSGQPCPPFILGVTDGMLQRLPVAMLRAILAHELGHVRLGHLEARQERGAAATMMRPLAAAFDRQQEAEADRFAIDLLRRLERRHPDACMGLVYALALLAEQPSGSGWLASHPSPDRRAERVLAGCNGG
jgi:Peptidase family M48